MPNRRLYYAVVGATISPDGNTSATSGHVVHGAQSMSIQTNFGLERIYELGQAREYEAVENVPDVTVSLTKVLDGYCPAYLLASNGASQATLEGRADKQSILRGYIYSDDFASGSGTPLKQVEVSGCFIASVNYSFPSEGNFTEEITLASNSKTWKGSSFNFTGDMFENDDEPLAITGSGGVNRREDFIFSPVAGGSLLPTNIPGITSSGTNESTAGVFGASITSIRVSTDMGRQGIKELGRKKDYYKFRSPTVITQTQIDAVLKNGDLVNAYDDQDNLTNQQIRIKAREGLVIDLGDRNKMESCQMGGFDAGGGNGTASFTYSTSNYFTVQHPMDITTGIRP